MKKNFFLFLLLSTFAISCQSQNTMIDKTVVKELNLDKYLGTWYEVARYDHSFERNLVGVTATYSMRDDGKIKVLNAGYKNTLDGRLSEAEGKAKIPNPEEPSKLKVSFFWIFYGDYYVMELGKNYEYALIGSSSDKYLWILSRVPHMDPILYQELLANLTKRGYDVSKLIEVPQK